MLSLAMLILIALGFYIKKDLPSLFDDFWFTSGLLLLILLTLIDQPHFSKDSNIFLNSITAGISLLLVEDTNRDQLFWVFTFYVLYLAISSYILMWKRKNVLSEENEWVQFISRLNRIIGRPEAIFSAFFIWGAIKQFGYTTNFNLLLLYWVAFVIFNIPNLAKAIEKLLSKKEDSRIGIALGSIFGVQSKNTFLVKLFEERPSTKLFDFVEFQYSIDQKVRKGLIVDVYLLNQEQWIKVLYNQEIDEVFNNENILTTHNSDVVYKIVNPPENDYLDRLIGIVTENSTIGKIRFFYNSKVAINEGQLLQATVNNQKVLYQVVEGLTKIEQLERKNQSGFILGEAIQLGTWNNNKFRFEQFGWVPNINTPIYLAEDLANPQLEEGEYVVGHIPNSNYPVIINKELAITHHTAIIGVTGTGKSTFARNLIREFVKDPDTKVICVDFTKEYQGKFDDIGFQQIIPDERAETIFKGIDWLTLESEKFPNQQNKAGIKKVNGRIKLNYLKSIIEFIQSDNDLAIFELPDLSNTSGILEYTKNFFQNLFLVARERRSYGKKICVVLEEAHTVIPEWNFIGIAEKKSQSLVNNIGQIALQGRKYDIGFMVIAQRTANVSKTVLTQCNSIISFQEFDKTSSDFLANYFGDQISKVLPNLKFRQAIAAGKAFKSNVPMIFEVPLINEDIIDEEE